MEAFALDRTRLLDGPFLRAQDACVAYLSELDPDRLLAPFRREAGLPPVAKSYGNWESGGLDGHIGGHYLSAASLLYAATGRPELKDRAAYVVERLAECQDALGTGYLGGVPRGAELWDRLAAGEVTASGFALDDRWVPLYNLHKTFAGLLDTHRYTGDERALRMAVRFADWWLGLAAGLSDDGFEEILATEFGGMNESFAELAARTGRADHLAMARRFSHRALLDPALAGRDALDGLHANTQIPKAVGWQRTAEVAGDPELARAAAFFFERVAGHRSVSVGGNSVGEHFHSATDYTRVIEDREGPETCNTANMLKLARMLFLAAPRPELIDFYERATFNHVLSSVHPDRPGFVYFTPMRPAHYRVYSSPQHCFWCCVGTGLENHARYGELIYTHDGDDLAVHLYLPSTLDWPERGLTLTQRAGFPDGREISLDLGLTTGPREFTLRLRRPAWAAAMTVAVNGSPVPAEPGPDGRVPVTRRWADGDRVTVELAAATVAEPLPDGSPWVSFRHGPAVLAARAGTHGLDGLVADDSRMGHVAAGPLHALAGVPVVTADPPASALKPLDAEAGTFLLDTDTEPVVLEPFAGIHDARYTVYWSTATPETLQRRRAELRRADETGLRLDERTADKVAAGEQQPETEHDFDGADTRAGATGDRRCRSATGWFGYTLRDASGEAAELSLTCVGTGDRRACQITVNGHPLAAVDGSGAPEGTFYELSRPLTDAMRAAAAADGRFEVRLTAAPGSATPEVHLVRLLRR
ncbi:beta-L-arabinofuranosidase domain-containing protein [Streptomyces litchfieldiae]|uniref:Glycoside hydrolase family 127 protein n=1 Tax=Streptomyces litchfieldiae TaxID=3075543 RepID=A0ABU2MX52_9ACTN|nr:beta-L-arabinofuranosidase domain-containing protein [Streptomyces sp. DSM 44938]MDT0345957.1 glycoside hydrolase family 127 protein [Streptomyces sp. DSM 44938]